MRRWGCRTFPTTFLVDGAGVVRHINRGWGAGYQGSSAALAARDAGGAPPAGAPAVPRRGRPSGPTRPPAREMVKGVEILRGP